MLPPPNSCCPGPGFAGKGPPLDGARAGAAKISGDFTRQKPHAGGVTADIWVDEPLPCRVKYPNG